MAAVLGVTVCCGKPPTVERPFATSLSSEAGPARAVPDHVHCSSLAALSGTCATVKLAGELAAD
jgi:hypothetical protein